MQSAAIQDFQVLLVDDDEEDFLLTRSLLGQAQGGRFSLDWACDYETGLQKIHSHAYDAVLVDYDLGAKTGTQLIRELTSNGCLAPFILYTGRGSYDVDVEAMEAGASFYISKGDVNPLLLERLIRYAVRQKRIERELEDNLQERQHILESIQDSFFSIDRDWTITYMNQKAAQAGDVDPGEIIGRNVWDVFKDLRNTPLGQKYQQVMQNRVPAEFETSGVFHNATYRVNIYPSAEGISVFAQEVSGRKQSEQPMENLDKFPSENPHPVFRVDLNGKLLYANPASQEVLKGWGISGSGVVPEHIRDIARQCFSGNCPGLVEERIGEKTFQVDFTPIQNEGYVNIYMVDQTLRKRTEEDLKTARNEAIREKNRLLAVMQVLPAGLSITDPAGGVVMANTAYERVWGHPIPETLSVHDYAAFHAWWLDTGQPVKPEEWASAQAVQQGKLVEEQLLKIQRFDGTDAYVLNSAAPIIDAQGNVTGSVVVIQDITNLYKLQTELKAANQDLQSIMDAAPAYIWITHDRQARNMTGNRATYELLQMISGENLSRTAPDVRLTRDYKTFKDGKEVPSKLLPVQRAAAGETIHNYEVDYVFDDGEVVRLVGNAAPLSNVPGNSEGAVGVFIDITLRKRMEEELRKLNEQLKNSNQELEKFAIIASHDMQEPLRKIISFSNILLAGGENLSETQRDYVMRLNSASSRMKRMIADLLDLSRISSHGGAFGRVDLDEVTAEVINDLEMQIRSAGARIELGSLPVIEGDAMQMHQLMQNLIGNAVKFHKADQKPRVQITSRRISPTSVQIMVEDNGIGFDETEAERIFRPFERLVGRSEYEGTGIGLAICEKIVARHAGEISVRSTPGKGSVFTITLPG